MALTHGTVAVGTAATLINGAPHNNWVHYRITNRDNTDAVYVGGAAVTINDGSPLAKEEHFDIDLAPGNRLYAVSAKTGHIISWISQEL